MRKNVPTSNSKCACKKIFSIPITCAACKLGSKQVLVQEKLKPKEEIIKVAAEPSNARANSKVDDKQNRHKLEAKLTKGGRTASLQGYNDAFSDYIARAKIRIRAVSSVGSAEKIAYGSVDDLYDTKKEDVPKDTFSVYINRAKMKIRKTSSIGSRKSISCKRE